MKNKSSFPYILPILLILLILVSSSCSHPQPPVSSYSYDSARTHYSNGLILFQNDSLIEALDEYLNALKIIETSDSITQHPRFTMLIHWQLGNLFSSQYMQEPAIVCYENALNYTGTSEDMPSDYTRLSKLLGTQYHRLQKYDTARYYYNEALQLLPDTNNLDYNQLQFYNAMLDCVIGEADEQYLGKLKKLAAQTSEPYRFTHFITIGEFYYEANQYDSAIVYLKPAFNNINDVELKCLAADFLQNIYQNRGDTLTASQYALYFTTHHEDDRVTNARTSTLNDMFQKHQQWEQQRLQTIEHQRFIKYITLLSILLILPILLILLLKKKKPSSTNSFSYRFSLFEKSEIVILIRERLAKNHDKMSVKNIDEQTKLSLDNASFVALRTAVDTHFDGLLKNLSTKYPDLNVNDLNCCCLAILGLSNTEMAVLLGVKYNSLTNRLAKIKKILSTEENLHDFLLKTLS